MASTSLQALLQSNVIEYMAALGKILTRGRRRPPTDAMPVMVRLPPDLLVAVDRYIVFELAAVGRIVARPEAVRHALRDWLEGHHYLESSTGAVEWRRYFSRTIEGKGCPK